MIISFVNFHRVIVSDSGLWRGYILGVSSCSSSAPPPLLHLLLRILFLCSYFLFLFFLFLRLFLIFLHVLLVVLHVQGICEIKELFHKPSNSLFKLILVEDLIFDGSETYDTRLYRIGRLKVAKLLRLTENLLV